MTTTTPAPLSTSVNGEHFVAPPCLDSRIENDREDQISIINLPFLTPDNPIILSAKVTNSDFTGAACVNRLTSELPMVAEVHDHSPAIQDRTTTSIASISKRPTNSDYALISKSANFPIEEPAKTFLGFFEETLSHASVAKSIIETHGEHLKWASDTKEWYRYDKSLNYWKLCDQVILGKLFLNEIILLQERVQNNSAFDAITKCEWTLKLQKANSSSFTKGVITLLPSVTNLNFKYSQLDSDPYLVGLGDGKCLDLKTVNVRPIKPADNLTNSIGTSFDENATCALWEKSVLEWCSDDIELVLFLQTLVGYSLSGLMTDQRLYFLYGNGCNGKSVFVNTLSALFGQNGLSIDPSSLMDLKRSSGQASGDIARLVGKRFISSNELPNNGMFNEELIKRLKSGDTAVARQLYKSEFEFLPVGKLFISGNNQPIIRGRDEGIWRRMTLIPFDAKITVPNRFLDATLRNELPGILNWAIEGWKIFLNNKSSLIRPEIIENATLQYRIEMDILSRWKDECLKPDVNKKVSLRDVYTSYKEWCTNESISCMSNSSFNRETKNMFEKKREKDGNFVIGYCLGSGSSNQFTGNI